MAEALNDADEVVGVTLTTGDLAFHAFFWKRGVMRDLGTVGGFDCSDAHAINSKGQVVGDSFACSVIPPPPSSDNAFLWQDGHMIDLNVFVPPGSNLNLPDVETINDRGEIFGSAVLPSGDTHAFMLIPCEEGEKDCIDASEKGTIASSQSVPAARIETRLNHNGLRPEAIVVLRAWLTHRHRGFGAWPRK